MKKLKRGFTVWQVVLWMMFLLKLSVKTSQLIDKCSALVSFLERWLLAKVSLRQVQEAKRKAEEPAASLTKKMLKMDENSRKLQRI
jgi:hypothetical protein